MLLQIIDIDSWKAFFDLIHDSATIVELQLDHEKATMSLLNNSHVCFYSVEYSKEFFDEYQVEELESILIFVADFYNIIKTASKNDILELSSNDYSLKIVLEHDENRRVFEIPLAEDYGESPTPPSIPFSVEFELLIKDLKQPCTDLDKIVKTDRFKMIASDDTLCIVNPKDSMTKYTQSIGIVNVGSASSTVNLHYVDELQKLNKISDYVTFQMGNDVPLTWSVVSVDECVKVNGLIAPILEDSDG